MQKWYTITEKRSMEENITLLLRKNIRGTFNVRITLTPYTNDPKNVVTLINVPYNYLAHFATEGLDRFQKIEFQPTFS